ncbi:collagenase [Massilia endophytica]|uniref:collagenase n=1 Tax=Massilia endophytica TaxID=2899220 RepID=UPI001E3A5A30|nr:collagenase [Massilia endophytica]UGQ47543.1 collagenase [Massilia endophytica]
MEHFIAGRALLALVATSFMLLASVPVEAGGAPPQLPSRQSAYSHFATQQHQPLQEGAVKQEVSSLRKAGGRRLATSLDCAADTATTFSLRGPALLDRLAQFDPDCMESLTAFFEINDATLSYYNNDSLRTVATAIAERSAQYTPENGQSIRQMLVFLRTGQYVAFYSGQRLVLDAHTRTSIANALLSFAASPRFLDPSPEHGTLMWDYFVVLGGADRFAELVPGGFRYLEAMLANPDFRSEHQLDAIADFFNALIRGNNNNDPGLAQLFSTIPAFYSESLRQAALYFREPLPGAEHASNRAATGALMAYTFMLQHPTARPLVLPRLSEVLAAYERFSAPWMGAVSVMDYAASQDCAAFDLCRVTLEPEIRALVFPNTFVFDDGRLKMQTALDVGTAQQLYHAIKQVKAQYHRKTRASTPLDDDPNEVLTMRIYGSRSAYERFQYYLEGLDTDNGGMYIEVGATFYTYERTPQESTLTLEELLRHEYTHYLEGRYTEHGVFGDPVYDNNRLTWFDEGAAEFFAGSTQTDGVKIRRALLEKVYNDGADRMAVADFIGASYDSGFDFYYYAGLFFHFLDAQRPDILRGLFSRLRANDVSGFDVLVAQLKTDPAIQLAYSSFLDQQLSTLETVPVFTAGERFNPAGFAIDNVADLQSRLRSFLPDSECVSTFVNMNSRAACAGILAAASADAVLNTAIKAALQTGLNNWRTLVCHDTGEATDGMQPYVCEAGMRQQGTPRDETPGAPSDVVATQVGAQVQVAFAPQPDAFGNYGGSHMVIASPGGQSAAGSGSPIVMDGLESGVTYTFVVTTTRYGVSSEPSNPSNSVTFEGPLPQLGTQPSSASGIGAWIQVEPGGLIIRWADPVPGTYVLKLDDGQRSIYYGGHSPGYAPILYSLFGLNGTETLRGQFYHYDGQRFVARMPEFAISLANFSGAMPPALSSDSGSKKIYYGGHYVDNAEVD